MEITFKRILVFALSFALSLSASVFAQHATEFPAQHATITLLETSDIHGTIAPWDYATDSPNDCGLEKVATIVKEQRKLDPNLILIDCGDNVQDNLIQEFRNQRIHPMVAALNSLSYDMHVLGNHEFNFEFKNLQKNIKRFKAPVITANIYKKNGKRFLNPYLIKEVNGVKIALIGVTAPHVERWEASNPEHFNNMKFTEVEDEIGKLLNEIGDKADVVLVVAHNGEDGEYGSKGMGEIAEIFVDKIPVYFLGHAHSVLNKTTDSGVLLVEPGSKGSYVAKVVLDFENLDGKWILTNKKGELLKIKGENIPVDEEMAKLNAKTHEKSREIANSVIGTVNDDFLPSLWWNDLQGIPTAVVQDTAMIDLINKVQMETTGADVSLAALFDSESNLTKGDFKQRDSVKIYKYDNTLMSVKISGAQLKQIMELQAGNFFNQSKDGDITISFDPNIRLYMYDMFAGVDYEIDISKPKGSRIKNVMYKGEPLKDDEVLVLALNNYRYGGLTSSGIISSSTSPDVLVYNTGVAIRDKISEYVKNKKIISPECDNNWKIVGFDYDNPQAQKVYDLVRSGKIKIETSADGRTPNTASLNVYELQRQGLLN